MLFLTQSSAVYGIEALIVDIEVNLQPARGEADKPQYVNIVGLPDTAVRESRERIRAAITNSGYFFPFHQMTVNLAPADVRKEGASFDLPIALGILGANGDLGAIEGLDRHLERRRALARRPRAPRSRRAFDRAGGPRERHQKSALARGKCARSGSRA